MICPSMVQMRSYSGHDMTPAEDIFNVIGGAQKGGFTFIQNHPKAACYVRNDGEVKWHQNDLTWQRWSYTRKGPWR